MQASEVADTLFADGDAAGPDQPHEGDDAADRHAVPRPRLRKYPVKIFADWFAAIVATPARHIGVGLLATGSRRCCGRSKKAGPGSNCRRPTGWAFSPPNARANY